jgi:hypothetical protein
MDCHLNLLKGKIGWWWWWYFDVVCVKWHGEIELNMVSVGINLMKIKFHLIESCWMTLHATWIELEILQNLNLIWIGFRFYGIESKFLNWIQIHWIGFEFQFNSIQFNSTIELRFNWRGMKCNLVEKIMRIYLWIWCREKKKNFKKTQEWQQNHKEGKVQDRQILMLLTSLKYWCKWDKLPIQWRRLRDKTEMKHSSDVTWGTFLYNLITDYDTADNLTSRFPIWLSIVKWSKWMWPDHNMWTKPYKGHHSSLP